MANNNKTDFGFQTVDREEKKNLVKKVFDTVAPQYDLMNDLMSLGIHRLWKQKLVEYMKPKPSYKIIDVAGGSADISLNILKKHKTAPLQEKITISDINPFMLQEGKKKLIDHGFMGSADWVCANGENLPFPDSFFDQYVISFGLRNFTNKEAALKEAYRVLKPGGQFFCLEFSKIILPIFSNIYKKYAFQIIPFLGEKIAKDRASYQYLVESIENFPSQEVLLNMMLDSGFEYGKYYNFTYGTVALHIGWKF